MLFYDAVMNFTISVFLNLSIMQLVNWDWSMTLQVLVKQTARTAIVI